MQPCHLLGPHRALAYVAGARLDRRVGPRREPVVLGLGDNMAEVLSYDRGRARTWELLSLVQSYVGSSKSV